jgi:hypothetical protein
VTLCNSQANSVSSIENFASSFAGRASPIFHRANSIGKFSFRYCLPRFPPEQDARLTSARIIFPNNSLVILYPDNHLSGEFMIVTWYLLVTALILPEISTQIRIELLEIGFWVLLSYAEPVEPIEGDPERPSWLVLLPRHAKKQARSFYTSTPSRHALNTFLALTVIMCDSDQVFSLTRIGSDPLEHAFGTERIKCRDVHMMERLPTHSPRISHRVVQSSSWNSPRALAVVV